MKKFTLSDGAALVVWLLPVVYLFYVYSSLPASVPVHYDADGNINRFDSKKDFLLFQLLMAGISAFLYLLLKFLPAIDPKRQAKYGEATFKKLALGIIIFISALNIVIIFSTVHRGFQVNKITLPLTGLLFAFLGNIMHSIKPNYFAGIRTPWTLESEDTWRATHRLAGKIWFAGGILLTVLILVLPPAAGTMVFTAGILLMVFIPIIYSYFYFKKHQLN